MDYQYTIGAIVNQVDQPEFIEVSRFQSIKTKILIFTLLATVIPALILGSLFYQQKFNEKPEYYFFVVPLLLFILAILQIFDHDLPLINLVGTITGLMFILFSLRLYIHMTEGGS